MAKIVCIVGLPGSGKTHLALNKYVPLGYGLIDDPSKTNFPVHILDARKTPRDYVITCPLLCAPENREKAREIFEESGFEVEFVFFENNQEKCRKNLARRADDRVIVNLDYFNYEIPEGEQVLEIWQP